MSTPSWKRAVVETTLAIATQTALAYAFYVGWQAYTNSSTSGGEQKKRNMKLLSSRGHSDLKLTEYESTIAGEIIHPEDINVGFTDIGGLDTMISSLRESVIYPLVYPHLFSSSSQLLAAPKGVLLYGPPGCGKTMTAKALAKESGATFINIAASVLTNKWYGESNKLVAGMFSLARKCQPAIIFLDEIDSFLRERNKGDHEVTGMMKAEFMTLWDGLTSSTDRIIVLGATNRIEDIDPAFLRRMPKRYAVGLPNSDQREKILSLMLAGTPLDPSFSLRALADATPGLSGSDLKELCRNAAMIGVRASMRSLQEKGGFEAAAHNESSHLEVRPLTLFDFVEAMRDLISIPRDLDDLASLAPSATQPGSVAHSRLGSGVSEVTSPVGDKAGSPVASNSDMSRIDEPAELD